VKAVHWHHLGGPAQRRAQGLGKGGFAGARGCGNAQNLPPSGGDQRPGPLQGTGRKSGLGGFKGFYFFCTI